MSTWCMHGSVQVNGLMYLHVEARTKHWCLHFSFSALLPWDKVSHWTPISLFYRRWLARTFSSSTCLQPQWWGYIHMYVLIHMPCFVHRCWRWASKSLCLQGCPSGLPYCIRSSCLCLLFLFIYSSNLFTFLKKIIDPSFFLICSFSSFWPMFSPSLSPFFYHVSETFT